MAPLEFVLCLPFLMVMMALMIDFGNVASWKVRAATVAREAVWREHWPHSGYVNPRPASWPQTATLGTSSNPSGVLTSDPFAMHTVVRGPTAVPNGQLLVDVGKVDYNAGLRTGASNIETRLPVRFPKLADFRNPRLNPQHPLLDFQMKYGDMGYSSNQSRRIWGLYGMNPVPEIGSRGQEYAKAVLAVFQAWLNPAIFPLDRDDEFRLYTGGSPDFHPSLRLGCELERDVFRITAILGPNGLVEQIQGPRAGGQGGLPENMANSFISMYERQIQLWKAQQPPPQAQIDALQQKVDQLKQFLGMLF